MSHLSTGQDRWDPQRYDTEHHYVTDYGRNLLDWLAPQPEERILDLGCGTGHLTHSIAQSGAQVLGIDNSEAMIAQARAAYPDVSFQVADATTMTFDTPFDAVFTNAALHWIRPPEAVTARVFEALKPGGRYIGEMGGAGNILHIRTAMVTVMDELGLARPQASWYFPTLEAFTGMLAQQGFEILETAHFERPTPLAPGEDSMMSWLRMFAAPLLSHLPISDQNRIFSATEARLRPQLYADSQWTVDYVRLRFRARRPAG